ncbi:MAG: ABC transporter ATP-binding protein [Clostridiales bacterium]|nr:ABC transporter ATP-binding protein [Clostridiales bacterium]
MISIKNLKFKYDQKLLFEGLSVDIPKGKFVSIIGPNGCGKSTLLKVINNELSYMQGQILIEGVDSMNMSPLERAKLLAFNRQTVNQVFPFTCLDYVLMGRRPHKGHFEDYTQNDLEIVENAFAETDTLNFIEKKLDEISGGELQRINLAKVLTQNTSYLLLDESFSAMDIYYKIKSLELLKKKMTQDRCILCVMHDLNLVYQFSDYVILMKEGKIYAEGMPDEVLTESTIKAVYGIHVEYIKNKGFLIRGEQHEKNDNFGIG